MNWESYLLSFENKEKQKNKFEVGEIYAYRSKTLDIVYRIIQVDENIIWYKRLACFTHIYSTYNNAMYSSTDNSFMFNSPIGIYSILIIVDQGISKCRLELIEI